DLDRHAHLATERIDVDALPVHLPVPRMWDAVNAVHQIDLHLSSELNNVHVTCGVRVRPPRALSPNDGARAELLDDPAASMDVSEAVDPVDRHPLLKHLPHPIEP